MVDLRDLTYDEQKRILRVRRDGDREKASVESKPKHQESNKQPSDDGTSLFILSEKTNENKNLASDEIEILTSAVDKQSPSDLEITSTAVVENTVSPHLKASQSSEVKATNENENNSHPRKNYPREIHPAYVDERRLHRRSLLPKSVQDGTQVSPNMAFSTGMTLEARVPSGEYPFKEKLQLPSWLYAIGINAKVRDRDLEIFLRGIKEYIPLAIKTKDTEQEVHFNKIRAYLHKYEWKNVTAVLLKRSRLLEVSGLPQLFFERVDGFVFPPDIRADAKMLFNKWAKEEFTADIMRGLKWGRTCRHSTSLDPAYAHRVSWKFFGEGDLVSGQWWPKLIACMRDGVHGSTEAGISSFNEKGATSVLIANPQYDDVDEEDRIRYCGTKSDDEVPTRDTKALHNNIQSGEPVRVIRSHGLPRENPYRPTLGFRYDGLYKVVGFEILDRSKAHHRFLLERLPGQDPIRYSGTTSRPTPEDISAYNMHQAAVGLTF